VHPVGLIVRFRRVLLPPLLRQSEMFW